MLSSRHKRRLIKAEREKCLIRLNITSLDDQIKCTNEASGCNNIESAEEDLFANQQLMSHPKQPKILLMT